MFYPTTQGCLYEYMKRALLVVSIVFEKRERKYWYIKHGKWIFSHGVEQVVRGEGEDDC